MSGEGLSVAERDALLRMCACGHSPNDHGSLAGCWLCPEENRECGVTFEDLLIERLAPIVEARSARRESEAAEKALREAAERLISHAPIIVNGLHANATRREWASAWLRARADSVAQGREESDK